MVSSSFKVLIADDSKESTDILYHYLLQHSDFDLVGIAHDGLETLTLIAEKNPDVVILDMIMPNLDGLGVLERVNSIRLGKKPIFVVLSAVGQDKITQKALNLGAEYYFIKPFDLSVLLTRLKDLRGHKPGEELKPVNNKSDRPTLEEEVTKLIREIGILPNLKGYQFIREAIMLAVAEFNKINSITSSIYPPIAQMYNTTPSRVERAIRHAIEVAWTKERVDKLNCIFGYTINSQKGKPTNSEFIAMIADKLRLKAKTA